MTKTRSSNSAFTRTRTIWFGVTGIILAKLDGTAKGGVVVSIHDQLSIPVKFVGLGETPEDIETFDPERFVTALFGERPGDTARA